MERIIKSHSALFIILSLLIISFALPAGRAYASTMYLSPASGSYPQGENFSVSVYVDADTSINAITGTIRFPTSLMNAVSIRKDDSIVDLWTLEPSYANSGESGDVTFEGVILNPGFSGQKGKILTIVFAPKATGSASPNFSRSSLLANDGKGTSIPVTTSGADYTLTPAKPQIQAAPKKSNATTGEVSNQTNQSNQVVIIREVGEQGSFDMFWEELPAWIRIVVVFSVGLTSIIFGFIALSFGILVLLWIWSNIWHRRMQFYVSAKLFWEIMKQSARQLVTTTEMNAKEAWGDTHYLYMQLKDEFILARSNPSLSFRQLLLEYFQLLQRVATRFLTRQEPLQQANFGTSSASSVDKFSTQNMTQASSSVTAGPKNWNQSQGNLRAEIDDAISE